jgi:hypothetical protein
MCSPPRRVIYRPVFYPDVPLHLVSYYRLGPQQRPPNVTQPPRTQFFNNCSSSAVNPDRECLCDVTVSLPKLNDLSQSVAMAGIARTSSANLLSCGSALLWSAHHRIGSVTCSGSARNLLPRPSAVGCALIVQTCSVSVGMSRPLS